jgi:hypothetical protein
MNHLKQFLRFDCEPRRPSVRMAGEFTAEPAPATPGAALRRQTHDLISNPRIL